MWEDQGDGGACLQFSQRVSIYVPCEGHITDDYQLFQQGSISYKNELQVILPKRHVQIQHAKIGKLIIPVSRISC